MNFYEFKLNGTRFRIRKETMDLYVVKEQRIYLNKINIDPEDVWLDAGAHIGTFSLSVYKKIKEIYAYEPDQDNFSVLNYNMLINKIENMQIYNSAIVENNDSKREFFINKKKNTGGHSFYIKRGREKVICKCKNINSILEEHNINKIKMDIEGAEYEVLKAIKPKNYNNLKEIILEFHFNILKDHPEHSKYFEIVDLFKNSFDVVDHNPEIKKHWHTIIHAYKQGL